MNAMINLLEDVLLKSRWFEIKLISIDLSIVAEHFLVESDVSTTFWGEFWKKIDWGFVTHNSTLAHFNLVVKKITNGLIPKKQKNISAANNR